MVLFRLAEQPLGGVALLGDVSLVGMGLALYKQTPLPVLLQSPALRSRQQEAAVHICNHGAVGCHTCPAAVERTHSN